MSKHEKRPEILVRNAQRSVPVSLSRLQSFARIALDFGWRHRRRKAEISSMSSVSVSIVSDRRMRQLHERFCGVRSPTDVLTFQHGEIVISAQTAARQAREFRSTLEREIRLYLLHGLLHLCGYDDNNPRNRAIMQRVQRRLLKLAEKQERGRSV